MKVTYVRADFNGLFGDILCLTHTDLCLDMHSSKIAMHSGMFVTAFEEDVDEKGEQCFLVAKGEVIPSPDWLQCRGSRWALHIDEHGVHHQTSLDVSQS
jgi:hypothetical protein